MEVIKDETTIPLNKIPHLEITRKAIDKLKEFVELLNKRKKFISDGNSTLTDYEQNERAILLMRTDIELAKVHSNIVQKEIYFKDFLNNVTTYMKEMESDWDKVMEKAKKKSAYNKEIETELATYDAAKFEENWEYKINHFIRIKTLLNPKKDPTKLSAV